MVTSYSSSGKLKQILSFKPRKLNGYFKWKRFLKRDLSESSQNFQESWKARPEARCQKEPLASCRRGSLTSHSAGGGVCGGAGRATELAPLVAMLGL